MRRCCVELAVGSWIAIALSCGAGGSSPALTDVRTVPVKGRFLVTPRWSPTGDRLLLSGWHGIGLHALDLGTGDLQDLDAQHRGAARWDTAGQVVPDNPPAESGELVLHDRDGLRILYRPYDGAIEALALGKRALLFDGGAWGPRVSPAGEYVAFCTGHLAFGRLRIVDVSGAPLFEGAGVQPAWLPDRAGLVYAVPQPAVSPAGATELNASELYAIGAPSWTPVRLTDTPDVVEMEPAISPQGDRIAFSDWKTGRLLLARFAETGGAR